MSEQQEWIFTYFCRENYVVNERVTAMSIYDATSKATQPHTLELYEAGNRRTMIPWHMVEKIVIDPAD